MATGTQYYIDILANNAGALSAISSLQSLDATVKKNDNAIKALESSYGAALAKANATPAGQAKWSANVNAVRAAEEKLGAAREKQQLALAKQDLYRKGLDKQVEGVKAAQQAEASRAAHSSRLTSVLESIKGKLGSVGEQAQSVGGPVGSLAGKLSALGKGGVAGAVMAIVVALGALAAAGVAAGIALTKYAFGAADVARTSKLMSEAALGSGSAAWELETVVDQMSDVAPGLAVKLKEVGRALADVEIRGRDAQRTLNTFRIVAGSSGEQAAAKITAIAESSRMAGRLLLGARNRFGEFAGLTGTGIKAADVYAALAKTLRKSIPEAKRAVEAGLVPFRQGIEALELAADTKLGGNVAKQLMSLSAQSDKLKENVAKIFAGANLEPFLSGLKTITDLFDTNTVTGYVLREAMTLIFTKVAEVAAEVFPYVRVAIMGVVAGILITIDIAKRLYRVLSDTFGGSSQSKIDKMGIAFKIGVGIVGLFVGSIVALTLAIAALGVIAAVATAPLWIPFALVALVIYGVVTAIQAVIHEAKSLGKEIEGIDLAASAGKMIDGLISGIKGKIADVKSAITDISEAITGAFSSDQEIRSPGRKAMRQGKRVAEGHALGLRENAGLAARASLAVSTAVSGQLELSRQSTALPPASSTPTFAWTNCVFGAVTQEQIEEMLAMAYLKQARGYAVGGAP